MILKDGMHFFSNCMPQFCGERCSLMAPSTIFYTLLKPGRKGESCLHQKKEEGGGDLEEEVIFFHRNYDFIASEIVPDSAMKIIVVIFTFPRLVPNGIHYYRLQR